MKTSHVAQALADYVSDGVIVADATGGLIYVNPYGLTLLGAGHSRDVLGKSLAVVFRPDDASDSLQPISFRARGRDDREMPVVGKLLRIDGGMTEVCGTSLQVLWKGAGRCRLLIVRQTALSDTYHRIPDQADGYWEPVEGGARVGSWERDLAAGTETWSDDQYRILGYEPGTVLPGLDALTQVLHPDDRDRVLGALEQSLSSDAAYDVECRVIHPGGAHRVIRCRGVVIRNMVGKPIRILGTTHDRTLGACSESAAERAVRESREQRDLVARSAHAGIFEWSHRTGRVSWSTILRDIFGVSPDAPVSLRRYVKGIHRADRERILALIRGTADVMDSSDDGRVQVEHRIVRPDGTVRYIRLQSLTRFEGEGAAHAPGRTIGSVVDVTDHILAEAYRREASKLMTVGTLVGGIAHEFNNSLTAVLGFSQLALPLIGEENKARRHIQQVIAAGRTSGELIQQLLMFSRRGDRLRRSLSLSVLSTASVKLLQSTIPPWVELRERIAVSTSPIEADETEMRQMLVILMAGAMQAMRSASGILTVELMDRTLSADLVTPHRRIPAGQYVCLQVTDSGEGLEPQAVAAIDDPFFEEKPQSEERGMGLSVVRDIVLSHGGLMQVESLVTQGTTVSVYLPVLTACASSVSDENASLPRGHEGILFVAAEESCARRGREMLESLGYYTVARTSVAGARAAFHLAPRYVDVLILDQGLFDMAGDQLVRECRRVIPNLPVILCGTSKKSVPSEKARLHGVTEWILQPLAARDVAHVIRRVLDRSPRQGLPLPHSEESNAIGPRR
ncbi:MAG: PAS domain-containing protein [Nitrospira sp.]|nr:PAS domain-containing protein [Nitrospira sp.]